MWKLHVSYESQPHSVIVTLGGQLYLIPNTIASIIVSLTSTKKCRNITSHIGKFSLFTIAYEGEHHITYTSTTFVHGSST